MTTITSRRQEPPIKTAIVPDVHRCGGRIVRQGDDNNRYRCQRCEQAFRLIEVIR